MTSPPAEFRLWALTDGWFAALDNLHDMPQEKRRSERRRRELSARVRGEPTELSVRLHKHGLYQNLFKEQRDWVQLGERIGLFPRGATTYLDEHFLLDRYVNWLDPGSGTAPMFTAHRYLTLTTSRERMRALCPA